MLIAVKNRDDMERGLPLAEPYVIISISCPNDPAVIHDPNKSIVDILRLEFDDLDMPVHLLGGLKCKMFSQEDAKKILAFFHQHKEQVKYLVVHCDAGISRSPAVAAALTKIQGGLDHMYFEKYYPNRRVFSVLLSEYFLNEKEA